MILGIGTDIVDVARIEADLDRFGEAFAERVLAPRELEESKKAARRAHFVARRFAAKEAAAKALGTGFSNGITLKDFIVCHDPHGRPLLEFAGAAADAVRQRGIVRTHLSLSDERSHAVAFVVFET